MVEEGILKLQSEHNHKITESNNALFVHYLRTF